MTTSARTFQVRGERFPMPSLPLIKTINVTNTGQLDNWPSHASGRFCSSNNLFLTKNKRLVVVNNEERRRPNLVPKPRFLEQLESYLQRELRFHGVAVVEPNPVRLNIHREVFQLLIEAFKTYKPLLASILREYDMMIAYCRDKIRRMEPMKETLWTLQQECDRKIIHLREKEKQELQNLKEEKKELLAKISDMQEAQNDLTCQVERLKEMLSDEHTKYRDEADARKLLTTDVNELRDVNEEMMILEKFDGKGGDADDPVKLKIALSEARKAHTKAIAVNNKLKADYYDVVPRRDYDRMKKNHEHQKTQSESLRMDFDTLQVTHHILQETNHAMEEELEKCKKEMEEMRHNSGGSPNWIRCAEFIYAGIERWKKSSETKGDDELVEILLREMMEDNGKEQLYDTVNLSETESRKIMALVIAVVMKHYRRPETTDVETLSAAMSFMELGESTADTGLPDLNK